MQETLGKALYHLNKAEYWQQEVERLEAWAEGEARRRMPSRRRRDGFELTVEYMVKVVLTDHFEYSAAIGNRNGHQQQANMYLLAHIARIEATDGDRGGDGKMRVPQQRSSTENRVAP